MVALAAAQPHINLSVGEQCTGQPWQFDPRVVIVAAQVDALLRFREQARVHVCPTPLDPGLDSSQGAYCWKTRAVSVRSSVVARRLWQPLKGGAPSRPSTTGDKSR